MRRERTRVLRIVTRLNIGGPAIHVSLLSGRLDPMRYETLLVAGRESPSEGSMLELGRLDPALRLVRVEQLGRAVAPLSDLRATARLIRIAVDFRPHVVHTHLAKAGFIGRIAGRLARAPAIFHTYHGTVFRGYFGRRESALYLRVERALAGLTTRLVAITPGQRQELVELRIAPADKIVVIPLGLDLAPFLRAPDKSEARAALGLPIDRPLLGLVARLVPIKDVGTFLRALALVREHRPDVQALIVGDGSERSALETLALELGLAETCRFLGWRADTPRIYAALDALVLSSLSEGSPVAAIEAMASARPVVATAVGGVPELVRDRDNGLLVPPGDARALADALGEVLDDDAARIRYGLAARAAVYPQHDASRLIEDIDDLYTGSLAGPRS